MRRAKRFSFGWALVWFLLFGVGVVVYLFWHWAKHDELIFLRLVDGQLVITAERQPRTATYGAPIIALLLAIGAIIGLLLAFGGGTDPALEEYFEQIAPVISTIDDRSEAQTIDSPNQAFASWADVLSETADDLTAIDPPGEVADAHQGLVDAIGAGAVALAELADQHPDVQSLDEASRLKDESEDLAAADRRAREACAELLEFARDSGVGIDLELC